MKFIKYLPLLAFIFLFAGFVKATPVHAKDSGVSDDVKVETGDDNRGGDDDSDENESDDSGQDSDEDKNDDKGDDNDNDDNGGRRGIFGSFVRSSDDDDKNDDKGSDRMNKFWSGIIGKVTAINGTTITISSMTPWNKDSKTTVYTVDATNAKIEKESVDNETISDIKVGDMIVVEGTVTGTTVVATEIHSGLFKAKWEDAKDSFVTSGDPVIGGTVTAVSDSTITIKNKDDVTYTINAKDAKIVRKGFDTSVLSDIKVGDNILVQGVVNNTTVTAKLILDTSFKIDMNGNTSGDNGVHRGFFSRVGVFFKGWFNK